MNRLSHVKTEALQGLYDSLLASIVKVGCLARTNETALEAYLVKRKLTWDDLENKGVALLGREGASEARYHYIYWMLRTAEEGKLLYRSGEVAAELMRRGVQIFTKR